MRHSQNIIALSACLSVLFSSPLIQSASAAESAKTETVKTSNIQAQTKTVKTIKNDQVKTEQTKEIKPSDKKILSGTDETIAPQDIAPAAGAAQISPHATIYDYNAE